MIVARETDAVHAGHFVEPTTGGIVPPIELSTAYARNRSYELRGDFIYGRYGLPTYRPLEHLAARLDSGADALVFASGMAGFTAVVETVPTSGHVVAPEVMYHGAQEWLRRLAETGRFELSLFDQRDPSALAAVLREGLTDLVWIETPVNPTWDVIDIAAAAEVAHSAGAVLAVDATVVPTTTRPIELGADLVFHSATKFYNGHSDVTGGILVTAADDARWSQIAMLRRLQGGVMGGFEAWLLLRGMRTLFLRVDRASSSALAIAHHFQKHPGVDVLYPGLESHPSHEIAKRQMTRGFGGMLSFLVKGGRSAARSVASSTDVILPATSLGGVESLIEHRASVEPPESRVPENLVRLSVGIEPVDELIADLELALSRAAVFGA